MIKLKLCSFPVTHEEVNEALKNGFERVYFDSEKDVFQKIEKNRNYVSEITCYSSGIKKVTIYFV